MKKFKLRDGFFFHKKDGSAIAGPVIIELDEKEAKENAHKIEEIAVEVKIQIEDPAESKKAKKPKKGE